MDKFIASVGGVVIILGGIMLTVIFGTLFGAVVGWVVGLFFGDTILGILDQIGIHHVAMWQFGAFMGFCCGFLRTGAQISSKD